MTNIGASDVGKVGHVTPIWPARPSDKVQDSTEQPKRRPQEKGSDDSGPATGEDGDPQHVDDYA